MRKLGDIPIGMLHCSGEDYLKTILLLEREKGTVRAVDIARRMGFSRPSVSAAVAVLRRAGHLTVDEDHLIHLTGVGRRHAERVFRHHQLLLTFFTAIGVESKAAEADAGKLEHLISDETFQALKAASERMGLDIDL